MNKHYLETKWEWCMALGGINAVCPISGKHIGHGGELHHILSRPSADDEIYRLASDKHLTILLHHDTHAKYHDMETTKEQKDAFFQAVYQVWAIQYGSIAIAYDMCYLAFNALQDALTTRIAYELPLPTVQIKKWSF